MGNCQYCKNQTEENEIQIVAESQEQINSTGKFANIEEEKAIQETSFIQLEIRTWLKESYSLFDYESKTHIKEQSFQINQETLLISKGTEIFLSEPCKLKKEENEQVLIHVQKRDNQFYEVINHRYQNVILIDQSNKLDFWTLKQLEELSNKSLMESGHSQKYFAQTQKMATKLVEKGCKIWLVVRSLQDYAINQGFRLIEGDVLKLGRVKLVIKEIKLKGFSVQQQNEQELMESSLPSCTDTENRQICRICLSYRQSEENPLINPCKCSGSMKYIHLECLQTWIRQRAHSRCNDMCTILLWKNLECELCKFNYPPKFKSDNILYDLIELTKPKNRPFMMFEFFQKKQLEMDNQDMCSLSNGIYIIFFGHQNTLRIGRAHDIEININDISVSRLHASLKQIGDNIYIQDLKSKFGTLVQLQKNIEICPELNGLEIQVGRNVINFQHSLFKQINKSQRKINFDKYLSRDLNIVLEECERDSQKE